MPGTSKLPNGKVEVSFPVREAQIQLTQAEYDLIRRLRSEHVSMIKFVKDQYSLGLYEAKSLVDVVLEAAPI